MALALRSSKHLKKILEQTEETQYLAEVYFANAETFTDILSTVQTKMRYYGIIAALWENARLEKREKPVSFTAWFKDKTQKPIFVLGSNRAMSATVNALNQAMFQRISELALTGEEVENDQPKTWIFFDETTAIELKGLSALMTQGRSKGVCMALGFQDLDGLQNVYNEKAALEIVGQCGSKAILRLESPNTAEWASKVFGDVLRYETDQGASSQSGSGGGSHGTSSNTHLVQRPKLLPSVFMHDIPPTNRESGLTGWYKTYDIPLSYPKKIKPAELAERLKSRLEPGEQTVKNMEERDPKHQKLFPWSQDELKKWMPETLADTNEKGQTENQKSEAAPANDEVASLGRGNISSEAIFITEWNTPRL